MKKLLLLSGFCWLTAQVVAQQQVMYSPHKQLQVTVSLNQQELFYSVRYNNTVILEPSRLGLDIESGSLAAGLQWVGVSPVTVVSDHYDMYNAKKESITYTANRQVITVSNKDGAKLEVIFQVSDNGVAFRYRFPEAGGEQKVTREQTTYHFPAEAKAWLQPMSVAKSGWEHTNPSYEENYLQDISVGTPSPTGAGWVYPALFQSAGTWMLISETAMDGSWCATRLANDSGSASYQVSFPGPKEVFTGRGVLPHSMTTPWASPWRLVAIGSLQEVVESTLGTDLAIPATLQDRSWIHPGKAAWSWIMSKDDHIDYDEQVKYIDLAAAMHWQYCLIDVNWDTRIGYDRIKELADYAQQKNVGLILWYNSAGDWNTVKYHPKDKLLTKAGREQEFARLEAMGIKGIKVDFFGGDGQSMIQYYIDILEDAARYKLMVNFHGATLPRGWARTYPQLVTTEAVKGFENVTFEQRWADIEANHAAMLPFTRNAFDPMDFTPMNLYKIPTQVIRKTTSAFELATAVLFLSGIQHYAESPEGMSHQPAFIKSFLQNLPDHWEDVHFIQGYPGKEVVIARRSGNKWYVAGINGEATTKNWGLNLDILKKKKGTLIKDGAAPLTFEQQEVRLKKGTPLDITVPANGGFVLVLE